MIICESQKKPAIQLRASLSPLNTAGGRTGMLKSEKGMVLLLVVILSAVILAAMTALVYMITTQTKISGMQKQYKTALEAARGGSDLFYDLLNLRGDAVGTTSYLANLNAQNLNAVIPANVTCSSGVNAGLNAKLLTATNTWSVGCDRSLNIDFNDSKTYDLKLNLGSAAVSYTVYAKITSTVAGDSGSGGGNTFLTNAVVNASGVISAGNPFLYSIEVLALNSSNPQERARLSILYQY